MRIKIGKTHKGIGLLLITVMDNFGHWRITIMLLLPNSEYCTETLTYGSVVPHFYSLTSQNTLNSLFQKHPELVIFQCLQNKSLYEILQFSQMYGI